jgi:PAS domain S-box-containing protein
VPGGGGGPEATSRRGPPAARRSFGPGGAGLKKHPRILIIDDDREDRSLATVVLSRELPDSRLVEIEEAGGFAVALTRGGADLVVTENRLQWSDGLKVLETVREANTDVPVILFSDEVDTELVVRGMKAGLTDYVPKSSRGFLRLATAAREALEQATHQQQVARSEPWLQTLLDRANVGVFRSTLDERLIEANPAVLRLLGVSSIEEALRVDIPTHFLQAGNQPDLLQRLNKAGELQARVVELERRDGTTVWLNLTEVLLLDVDGDIVVDVLMQDVSHLKQHESDLHERMEALEKSNEDLSNFASIASHELREPLRTIGKHVELVSGDLEDRLGEGERDSMRFVVEAVGRMQMLVGDLLEFSRVSSGWKGFQVCDCNTVVDRAVRNLQPAIEESGAVVRRQGLPTVMADAAELEHVFQNLISNAIKFHSAAEPRVTIRAVEESGEWVFVVEDNGIGIKPDDQKRIFETFTRLDPDVQGTGIGLALCRKIVERHGGRIWVESKVGKGSKFLFTIPVGSERETPQANDSTRTSRSRRS